MLKRVKRKGVDMLDGWMDEVDLLFVIVVVVGTTGWALVKNHSNLFQFGMNTHIQVCGISCGCMFLQETQTKSLSSYQFAHQQRWCKKTTREDDVRLNMNYRA